MADSKAVRLMKELVNKGVSPIEMLEYILHDYMYYKNAIQVMHQLEYEYFPHDEEELEIEI
jgi:hypothetical protein